MLIFTEPIICKVERDGSVIEEVMEFTYLGVIFSYTSLEDEVKEQVTKVNRVARCLNNLRRVLEQKQNVKFIKLTQELKKWRKLDK